MTEIKAGDTVTFNMAGFKPWQGGKGIVRKVDSFRDWGYKVELLEVPPANDAQRVGNKVDCNAAMLKLVEPQFEVGDLVKVLKTNWAGRTGEVTATDGNIWPYKVRDATGCEGSFSAHEIELVPAPKPVIPPKPKFQEGDLVKSIGFQYSEFAGKSLVVEGYAPEDATAFPYRVRAVGESWIPGHCFREDELELVKRPVKTDGIDISKLTIDKSWAVGGVDAKLKAKVIGKFPADEAVEHPAHYGGDTTYEVIKVAEAWGLDKDAYLFNVLKYIARAGKKGSAVEDLKKGGFYLNRKVKQLEAAK